jgi:hypothetical protein
MACGDNRSASNGLPTVHMAESMLAMPVTKLLLLKLSTILDDHRRGRAAALTADRLDLVDHVKAARHLSEYCVLRSEVFVRRRSKLTEVKAKRSGAIKNRYVPTCLPSSHGVSTVQMKNWLPFVPGPALAMDKMPLPTCVRSKFSSSNLVP